EAGLGEPLHNVVPRHPPLRAVPRRWRRIVSRCLAKEPLERYQSMRDVAHDLRDSLAEPGMAGGLTTDARLWLVAIVLAAVLIALLMLLRENFTEEIRRIMPALTPPSCSIAFTAARSLPVRVSGATRSSHSSAPAAWARSMPRATRPSAAASR